MTVTVSISSVAVQDFFSDGIPLTGGRVFIYYAGTNTKLTTYTDASGATPQTSPILLNSRGEPENSFGTSVGIWIPDGIAYKIVLAEPGTSDPPTNVLYTVDNLGSVLESGLIVTWTGTQTVANTWLGGEAAEVAYTIPAGLPGSEGVPPKTLPASTYTVGIKRNGTQIATAQSSAIDGSWTFACASSVSVAVGDVIDFIGPGDTTIANFGLTIKVQL